jgi:large subunit ribosomal protein L17
MRHGDKINNLGRKKAHRDALLATLASELIVHKRIVTTLAKAKALRTYVEPLITKTKKNASQEQITHQHRVVFSYLGKKEAVKELFTVVAPKVADRPGGYSRIIKLGARHGDNAEMAMIELVDFNELYGHTTEAAGATKRTRRGRAKKSGNATIAAAPVVAQEVVEEVAIAEEVVAPEAAAPEAKADETEDKEAEA